ncbi:fimbrial protein [Metapseudomonas boanensis]|uniref:Type 1 fimbrial protein n=1 Tax=Metapseudomonas boanensis TaxID=2822138 RepID=A0ABS5XNP6_9GAMM|nr:fimbrial protein [Pseudomonas boanensis]MBT8769300.1 type 1 fimbrial protein [Pseudomonas boanensis]
MKLSKLSLAVFGALAVASTAVNAASAGSGKVNFEGSIIDAPCTLDAESANQTVRIDQVSNKQLANNGMSEVKDFTIELRECDAATLKKVKVTFGGDIDTADPSLLAITGSASGAGIAITKGNQQVKLGEALPAHALVAGDNTLLFGARLKGTTAKDVAVTPGEFKAVTNFQLAYE